MAPAARWLATAVALAAARSAVADRLVAARHLDGGRVGSGRPPREGHAETLRRPAAGKAAGPHRRHALPKEIWLPLRAGSLIERSAAGRSAATEPWQPCPWEFDAVFGEDAMCRKLGQGSFGCVFAVQPDDGETIAVKVGPTISESSAAHDGNREVFDATLESMKLFRGGGYADYFVQVLYSGALPSRSGPPRKYLYYAMELARGDLADLDGSVFLPRIATYTADWLCGLQRMHDQGFIYLDLSRKNMLIFDGPDGRPALKFADLDGACMPGAEAPERHSCRAKGVTFSPGSLAPELWPLIVGEEWSSINMEEGVAGDMYALGWLILRSAVEGRPDQTEQYKAVERAKEDLRQSPPYDDAAGRILVNRHHELTEEERRLAHCLETFDVSAEDVFQELPKVMQEILPSLLSPRAEDRGTADVHLETLGARC